MSNNIDYNELVEKSKYNYKKYWEMTNICLQYVIDKRLVIFGGLSIDFALKKQGCEGIYKDYQLMDIDVFSNKHYDDAVELLEIFINLGYENCQLIVALHPTSIRLRIDHYMIFDIAYAPDEIYELYANTALTYETDLGQVLIRHPYIQVLDFHRSLSYPYENQPLENIKNRFKKDYERYLKTLECYPLDYENIKFMEFIKESDMTSSSTILRSDIQTIKHNINKNYYIHGILAYLLYEKIFIKHISNKIKPLDLTNLNKTELLDNELILPKDIKPLYMVTPDELEEIIKNKKVTRYYKYMDIIPEITKVDNTHYFSIIPGTEPGYIEYNGYKIISIHFVLLWLLYSWLTKQDDVYLLMYKKLYEMIQFISKNDFIKIAEHPHMLKFFPSIKVDFINKEIQQSDINPEDKPQSIYYIKEEGKVYNVTPFIYEGKKLFNINGKKITQ